MRVSLIFPARYNHSSFPLKISSLHGERGENKKEEYKTRGGTLARESDGKLFKGARRGSLISATRISTSRSCITYFLRKLGGGRRQVLLLHLHLHLHRLWRCIHTFVPNVTGAFQCSRERTGARVRPAPRLFSVRDALGDEILLLTK